VPTPEAADIDEVLTVLPHGTGSCKAVLGGLEVPNDGGKDARHDARREYFRNFSVMLGWIL